MGKHTGIAWCDHTFSAWWGCFKISQGCKNCYAEGVATRFGSNIWGPIDTTDRRTHFTEKHSNEPLNWNRNAREAGVMRKVFSASMSDVFEDHPQVVDARKRLWDTVKRTDCLIWQLLTKRPENIERLLPADGWGDAYDRVWLGTSVEDSAVLDRVDILREIDAKVRWLSVEPMIGRIEKLNLEGIHWVVVGGESGSKARPMDIGWVRELKAMCDEVGAAFFMKQLGTVLAKEMNIAGKGDEMLDFPEDLRVRDFPAAAYLPVPPKAAA